MNAMIIILLGLAALVAADGGYGSSESQESYESSEAQYNFKWNVDDSSSENHFGQEEGRDSDDTKGTYYVQLPDGRLQTVAYYVSGDSGYIADVKYSGEAQFDSVESGSYESRYGSNESK